MPALFAQSLSYQLDSGEWLFQHLNFNLNQKLTGLVGRNGVGKSLLLSLLQGNLSATTGQITRQGKVLSYSQLPSALLDSQTTIAEFLGIKHKLDALAAIENGAVSPKNFDTLGDDWDIAARANALLNSLGINTALSSLCSHLSGGQLARLQLQHLFSSDAEILLLDEPSNHLDQPAKLWLIEQLKLYSGRVLLISHDRALLRQVDCIYQLANHSLTLYPGNYDDFEEASSAKAAALSRQIAHCKQEKKRQAQQAQINRERAQQRQAKGLRSRKSASQSKLLLNAMKESAGQSLATVAKREQSQLQRHQQKVQQLTEQQEQLVSQALYLQPSDCMKKSTLVNVENCQLNVACSVPLSFKLSHTDRLHLRGENGCGKSTLLKAIQGEYQHYDGTISRYTETVYLDQHFGLLDAGKSVLSQLMHNSEQLTLCDARTLLAGIGFRGDTVHRPVRHLSGGEKMKLSMLIVSHFTNSPLLLLDEPDNHLDLDSKQLLAAALNHYKGAFILVSHDLDFANDAGVEKIIDMQI